MKKILSVIFAFILIFSCFAVTAFAEDVIIGESDTGGWFTVTEDENFNIFEGKQPIITFSENFNKMYVDNESFSRFDASMLLTDFGYSVLVDEEYNSDYYLGNSAYVDWTDAQKETVSDILIETNLAKNMYRIELHFTDGSTLTVYFLQDTYFEEYNEIINGNAKHYLIDFMWPDGNIVTAEKSALFGETVTFDRFDLIDLYDFYYVSVANKDNSISVDVGQVFSLNDEFYYLDYAENGFDYSNFYIGEVDECTVHKITDEALLAELTSAEQRYYEDDYGYLYDDSLTETVSAVFLVFVFAVIPAVIFVIFLIKAIRGKGAYKKIYGAVAAFCIAELAVFTVIATIITNLN